jgi:hypothetical protein
MNGVHDMGGMHGMGPIVEDKNEPVFHHEWEGRIFAMNLAMGAWRKWNIDASRHARELIPPAEYLRMSYYEKWVAGLIELIVKSELVTRDEIESAAPAAGSAKAVPAATRTKRWPELQRVCLRSGTWMCLPGLRSGSGYARATCIQWDTRGCRVTREDGSGPSTVTMVFLFSRTPMLISSVRTRSTFIRYALLPGSCGALRRGRKILCA